MKHGLPGHTYYANAGGGFDDSQIMKKWENTFCNA